MTYEPKVRREEFKLSCGHVKLFRQPFPYAGDEIWCLRCNDLTMVIESHALNEPGVFAWKCVTHNTTRKAATLAAANNGASRHWRKFKCICRMAVIDGGKVVDTWGESDLSLLP